MSLSKSAEKSVTRQRVASPNVLQYANEKRNKGTFNDVTIEAGSDTIAANRMILSCCSRFFEGMFDLEMKEKYQDSVQINGFDGKAVKALIDFIYSGEVTIKNENVMDLLAVSDYLQVDEVKQFCFDFLESILSSDNWYAIRSAADLYQNKHLQSKVEEFISKSFDAVIETNEFKSLDKNGLRCCIEKVNRNHVREILIFNGLVAWSYVDNEARKNDFPELFEQMVQLDGLSVAVLEKTVFKEDLVKRNNQCLNLVTKSLCQRNKSSDATKIVSLGGIGCQGKCFEVYSCTSEPLKSYSDLPIHLDCHCSLKASNYIYCIGGRTEDDNGKSTSYKNVWKMNMNDATVEWQEVTSLNQKRCLMGGAVFRDVLVVAGGVNEKQTLTSVEYYQSAIDEWKTSSPLCQPRSSCVLVASNHFLFALGGWSNNRSLSSVERTENLKERWQQIQPMQIPRQYFAAVNCSGIIYALGGQSGKVSKTTTNTVERYDSDDDKWSYVSSMKTERSTHAACVMNDKIYVVGGIDASDNEVNTIECYDTLTDSWSVVGKTDVDLFYHAVVAL